MIADTIRDGFLSGSDARDPWSPQQEENSKMRNMPINLIGRDTDKVPLIGSFTADSDR